MATSTCSSRCAIAGELDRHLPGVLPADGSKPRSADQARLDQRRRDHLGLVTVAGVLGAHDVWVARAIHLTFLFERPARFWLAPKPTKAKLALQPAR